MKWWTYLLSSPPPPKGLAGEWMVCGCGHFCIFQLTRQKLLLLSILVYVLRPNTRKLFVNLNWKLVSFSGFPGFSQFLIACSVQKQREKAWWILPRDLRRTVSRHKDIFTFVSSYREARKSRQLQQSRSGLKYSHWRVPVVRVFQLQNHGHFTHFVTEKISRLWLSNTSLEPRLLAR